MDKRRQLLAQFCHLIALGGKGGGEPVVFLLEIGKEFAQFALRLGVIGVVRRAAHGTGRALFELLAELHDVFGLAKGVGGANAILGALLGSPLAGRVVKLRHLLAYDACTAAHPRLLPLASLLSAAARSPPLLRAST